MANNRHDRSYQCFLIVMYSVHGLITNFHQPRSTLLMLVSAFVGENGDISEIYNYALEQNYRFLSYGDSSLLLPFKNILEEEHT